MSAIQRREWATKGTMDPLVDGSYREETYQGYLWQCVECGLVWERKHQATNCEGRGHVSTYQDGPYGVRMVLNGVPVPFPGGTLQYYERRAVRREGLLR